MSGENSIPVYEFSKGFKDIRYNENKKRWESGGFLKDIDQYYNNPVPEEIKSAVKNRLFAIENDYPPADGDFALIAMDIGQYSVLAVATKIFDNQPRNLVAYRYFWLKRCEVRLGEEKTQLDGIGTLLDWWYDAAGQPKYKFPEETASVNLQEYPAKPIIREDFNKYHPEIQHIFTNIDYVPYAHLATKSPAILTPQSWHCLALTLEKEYNLKQRKLPFAWAWNVGWLEHPETFTLILSADTQTHNHNSSEVQKHKADLRNPQPVAPATHSGNFGGQMVRGGGVPPSVPQKNPTLTKKIKDCLTSLSLSDKPDQKRLSELVNYLEQSSSDTWEWNTIDTVTEKRNPSVSDARYKALLAILKPGEVPEWLSWLRKQNKSSFENHFLSMVGLNKTDFEEASLTIQQQLLEASSQNRKDNAYNQLVNNIYYSILQMLLKCKFIASSLEEYKRIEWLLVHSKSLWSSQFKKYAKYLVSELHHRRQSESDQFQNEVLTEIHKWESYNNANQKPPQVNQYKTLAELFKSTNESLSALFYQLSQGSVPSDICDNAQLDIIIPLIRSENPSSSAKEDNPLFFLLRLPSNNKGRLIIIFVIIAILALAAGMSFATGVFHLPNLLQANNSGDKKASSGENDFSLAETFDRDLYLWTKTGNKDAKDRIKKFIAETDEQKNKATDIAIKNWFTPLVSLSINDKDIDKNPIKPGTSGSYSQDVKIVQTILKALEFYQGDPTGSFDENDSLLQAINSFQSQKVDIQNPTGKVASKTWQKMKELFEDKQLKLAKDFLVKKFENPNDTEIKKDINELFKCKGKGAIDYIDCVNNLMTPYTPPPTPTETTPPSTSDQKVN